MVDTSERNHMAGFTLDKYMDWVSDYNGYSIWTAKLFELEFKYFLIDMRTA